MNDLPEFPLKVRMATEYKSLGFYLTCHPLDYYGTYVRAFVSHSLVKIGFLNKRCSVLIGGICLGMTSHLTLKGSRKHIVNLSDGTDSRDILIFMDNSRFVRFLKPGDIGLFEADVDEVDSAKRVIVNGYTPVTMSSWKYGRILVLKIDNQNYGVLKSYVPGLCSRFPGHFPVFVDSTVVPRGYQNYRVTITPNLVRSLMDILGNDKVRVAGKTGIAVSPFVRTLDEIDDGVKCNSVNSYSEILYKYGDKNLFLLNNDGKICSVSSRVHVKDPAYYTADGLPYWVRFGPDEYCPSVTRKRKPRRKSGRKKKKMEDPGIDIHMHNARDVNGDSDTGL